MYLNYPIVKCGDGSSIVHIKNKRHIDIEITTDELDLTCAEAKATYEQIKAYVKEKHGMKLSNLYIAQVKRENRELYADDHLLRHTCNCERQ